MAKRKTKRSLNRGRTTDAVDILYRRYIKGRPEREKQLNDARSALSLGEYIRDLREKQELTQQQLADAIGSNRTAISRLESADYEGHSISLLNRIAKALHGKLIVRIDPAKTDATKSRELVFV